MGIKTDLYLPIVGRYEEIECHGHRKLSFASASMNTSIVVLDS